MTYLTNLLLATITIAAPAQMRADNIIGKWANEDGTAHFEIYKNGAEYNAKIIWLKNDQVKIQLDKNNPDRSLRTRSVTGIVMLTGLTFSSKKNEWINGKIYSPEKGVYANCTVSLITNDELKITASKGFITSTKKWNRYE